MENEPLNLHQERACQMLFNQGTSGWTPIDYIFANAKIPCLTRTMRANPGGRIPQEVGAAMQEVLEGLGVHPRLFDYSDERIEIAIEATDFDQHIRPKLGVTHAGKLNVAGGQFR